MTSFPSGTAAARGLACCHTCGKLSAATLTRCRRCGAGIHLRIPHSLQTTMALLVTAVVLFVPANVLPIMHTEQLGRVTTNTIVGGVIRLWEHGSYPIALVIFIASILIPIAKIFALVWLCLTVGRQHPTSRRERALIYRVTEFIGRWSMIDVFVVAVLVALIQLGGLLTIRAGPAALAFAGVVIATMLAALAFDSRLIWDATSNEEERND